MNDRNLFKWDANNKTVVSRKIYLKTNNFSCLATNSTKNIILGGKIKFLLYCTYKVLKMGKFGFMIKLGKTQRICLLEWEVYKNKII